MLRGNRKIPSSPTPFFLSVGASPCVLNHYFALESKDAIDKDHDMDFNSFLGESALNSLENMLPPPQHVSSFESGTLTYSF